MKRETGILLPLSALPSRHGVGCLSADSFRFIDLLKAGGFSLWQILPLNPLGYGNSPYQPFSSYAIDPIYIDLDGLTQDGLLKVTPSFNADSDRVDYDAIRAFKEPYLRTAFGAEMAKDPKCLKAFEKANPWVREYASFMVLKAKNQGAHWNEWDEPEKTLMEDKTPLIPGYFGDYEYWVWLEKTAYSQYGKLHDYAKRKGVSIMGDIPFYVGFDSADVWAHKDAFQLGEDYVPSAVAGVPPDYFSATGQRWGNPIYDWDALAKNRFGFLKSRIVANANLYDLLRIDHFRAFDTYWKIPAECPTAIDGEWIEAPGYKFFDQLLGENPNLTIVAEDLGLLRQEVYDLRDHYSFPGMNVIQFSFRDAEIEKRTDWDKENLVAYLGTHDNDTLIGFVEKMDSGERNIWEETLKNLGFAGDSIEDSLIDYALSRKARYVVFQMQDILGLGNEARMNVPGLIDGSNWTWKLTDFSAFADSVDGWKGRLASHGRAGSVKGDKR